MSDSPVSPEDIRAAAETYQELGPQYHDAVVASFLEKVDREVAARVEARLADLAPPRPAQPPQRRSRRAGLTRRRAVRDVVAAGAGALAVVGVVAAIGVQHGSAAARNWQVHPVPAGQHEVIVGPNGKRILLPQVKVPQPPSAPKPPAPPN